MPHQQAATACVACGFRALMACPHCINGLCSAVVLPTKHGGEHTFWHRRKANALQHGCTRICCLCSLLGGPVVSCCVFLTPSPMARLNVPLQCTSALAPNLFWVNSHMAYVPIPATVPEDGLICNFSSKDLFSLQKSFYWKYNFSNRVALKEPYLDV